MEAVKQPQIDTGMSLLASKFDQGGLMLDLYGESNEFGIEVCDVALHGQKISLSEMVTPKQLEDMSYWCERQQEREAAQDRKDNQIDAAYLLMLPAE